MDVEPTALPEVLLIRSKVNRDERGSFRELWHRSRYAEAGLNQHFVQDNLSVSRRGVIRGLHYQYPHSQGKLVSVVGGVALDVAVDIRRGSPTFGQWIGCELSANNGWQLWIPGGFAHGFAVLSSTAIVQYKCTDVYRPNEEGNVHWNDPRVGISWPFENPIVGRKDREASLLSDIPGDRLPIFGLVV